MDSIDRGNAMADSGTRGRNLILEAGDLVARIPSRCFRPGARDLKRPIRIPLDEVLPGLERGRVVLPLGRIAALCPEIFGDGVHGNRDLPVELPLARLVQQIPEFVAGITKEVGGGPLIVEVRGGDDLLAAETSISEGGEMIRLNLSSVLRGARGKILDGPADPAATVAVPLALVEAQLGTGRVAFKASKLAEGVPPEFKAAFEAAGDLEVDIPLDEIFKNLPGGDLGETGPEPAPPETSAVAATAPVFQPAERAPAPADRAAAPADPGSQIALSQQPDVLSATGGPDVFGRRILAGGPSILMAAQKSTREGGGDEVDQIMGGFASIESIQGCAVVLGRDLRLAGTIPSPIDPRAFRDQAWDLLEEIARRGEWFGLKSPASITWRTASGNATLMARGEVCACAFHAADDLGEKGRAAMVELLDRLTAEL
jgi:hypothetical protein